MPNAQMPNAQMLNNEHGKVVNVHLQSGTAACKVVTRKQNNRHKDRLHCCWIATQVVYTAEAIRREKLELLLVPMPKPMPKPNAKANAVHIRNRTVHIPTWQYPPQRSRIASSRMCISTVPNAQTHQPKRTHLRVGVAVDGSSGGFQGECSKVKYRIEVLWGRSHTRSCVVVVSVNNTIGQQTTLGREKGNRCSQNRLPGIGIHIGIGWYGTTKKKAKLEVQSRSVYWPNDTA